MPAGLVSVDGYNCRVENCEFLRMIVCRWAVNAPIWEEGCTFVQANSCGVISRALVVERDVSRSISDGAAYRLNLVLCPAWQVPPIP